MDQLWNHQTSYSSMVKWSNFLVQVRNYEVMDFLDGSQLRKKKGFIASLLSLANNWVIVFFKDLMDICEIEKYLKLVFGISVVLQRRLIFWREWILFMNVLLVSGNGIVSNCLVRTQRPALTPCVQLVYGVFFGNGWVNSSWLTWDTINPIRVYARNTFVYLQRTFKWQVSQRFSLLNILNSQSDWIQELAINLLDFVMLFKMYGRLNRLILEIIITWSAYWSV